MPPPFISCRVGSKRNITQEIPLTHSIHPAPFLYSSMVEHMTVNHGVVGSNPTGGAIIVEVSLRLEELPLRRVDEGASPSPTAYHGMLPKWLRGLVANQIAGFMSGIGSNPIHSVRG